MSNVIHVNQDQFQSEILQSQLPVLVDFYASWCPPCRALGPILDRLSEEFAGQVKIAKINSDEEQALAAEYNVTGLPTLIFFEDGKNIKQFAGLPREEALRVELQGWVDSREVTN